MSFVIQQWRCYDCIDNSEKETRWKKPNSDLLNILRSLAGKFHNCDGVLTCMCHKILYNVPFNVHLIHSRTSQCLNFTNLSMKIWSKHRKITPELTTILEAATTGVNCSKY